MHILEEKSFRTACVILARGGSKGIPKKNLRKVGGVSLIGRSVRAGRLAKKVDAVFVSTDDKQIANVAKKFGADVIDRPAELAKDTATSESGWLHAKEVIEEKNGYLEALVFLQCTSPFTTGSDIDACIDAMISQDADCALSVVEDHSFLWTYDADGSGLGINHNEREQRKRRQDLPPSFRESGAIYCVKAEAFARTGQRFCGKVALSPVHHPPLEIDSYQDLTLCSIFARSTAGQDVLTADLQKIRAVVMDFDGVHTDNLVTADETGKESVMTSRGDGMGLEMLREMGHHKLMILSKERNPAVLKRAKKLEIEVYNSIDDKVSALDLWLDNHGLSWDQLLYVGNDINDLEALNKAGLSACPEDSHPDILCIVDWVLSAPGGKGALRIMADTLLQNVK